VTWSSSEAVMALWDFIRTVELRGWSLHRQDNTTLALSCIYCISLSHADDVNLLGDSINIIKGNTKTLLEASSDVGVETTHRRQNM
jgi:hypothetical protein